MILSNYELVEALKAAHVRVSQAEFASASQTTRSALHSIGEDLRATLDALEAPSPDAGEVKARLFKVCGVEP